MCLNKVELDSCLSEKDLSKLNSGELINELYQKDYTTRDTEGNFYEIPQNGSLGLLASGYAGLIAWRKKKGFKI